MSCICTKIHEYLLDLRWITHEQLVFLWMRGILLVHGDQLILADRIDLEEAGNIVDAIATIRHPNAA